MREAFQDDLEIRREDEGVPMSATRINVREFSGPGACFTAKDLTVTAFAVNHGPLIRHTYGYRVDHRGRSVVISGDTKYDPTVAEYGRGVDLLVHEVCAAAPEVLKYLNNQAVMDHHTSPENAGRIFAQAQPRMAAYTHIIQLTQRGATTEPDTELMERATRQAYAGPLVIGKDLTRFEIGDSITVKEWNHDTQSYD